MKVMGHWYDGNLTDFSKVMREQSLPLDNIFSKSDGYVARQTAYNDPRNRVLTWEFSRQCHSFVTLPIPVLSVRGLQSDLEHIFYRSGIHFPCSTMRVLSLSGF